jgi:hypothetical protein
MSLIAIPGHVLNTLKRGRTRHASEWKRGEVGGWASKTSLDQFGVCLLLRMWNGWDFAIKWVPFRLSMCVCVCVCVFGMRIKDETVSAPNFTPVSRLQRGKKWVSQCRLE